MRLLRRAFGLLALLIMSAALFLVVQAHRRPAVAPFEALLLPEAPPVPGEMRVRFAGVSSLVFDGQWDAVLGNTLKFKAGLARSYAPRSCECRKLLARP